MAGSLDLTGVYRRRFPPGERRRRAEVWRVLCQDFFQRYVAPDATVLDLGAGYCEFINHIRCGRKIVVDLGAIAAEFAGPDVEVHRGSATDLSAIGDTAVDVVFISNLLEHLADKNEVVAVVLEVARVLKAGGRAVVLQPNIRFTYREYWDFFDHNVPLSDRSLTEVLLLGGFEIERVIPRFLPYTTRSSLPQHPVLVALYLRFPPAWRLLGGQTLVVARKPRETSG